MEVRTAPPHSLDRGEEFVKTPRPGVSTAKAAILEKLLNCGTTLSRPHALGLCEGTCSRESRQANASQQHTSDAVRWEQVQGAPDIEPMTA